MQQRIKRTGHAAAWTIQPGEPVKLADRIKNMGCRVKKENDGDDSQPCGDEKHSRKPRIGWDDFGRSRVHSNGAVMPTNNGRSQRELKYP